MFGLKKAADKAAKRIELTFFNAGKYAAKYLEVVNINIVEVAKKLDRIIELLEKDNKKRKK
jgi:hypothetical protein